MEEMKQIRSKNVGSGGLLNGKNIYLSLTYNCPTSEFSNKMVFDGLTLDTHVLFIKLFNFVD